MKQFDVQPTQRPSVSLFLVDQLVRPGRAQFRLLPTIRFLWRHFEPMILTKPIPPAPLQTQPHHLTIGSIGTGRLVKPVEELIAWAIEKGQLTRNPILRKTLARTALLGRPVHIIFPSVPEQLVFSSVFALCQMAIGHGIDRMMLHPIGTMPQDVVDGLTGRLGNVTAGRLTEIENYDTLLLVNFAPYSNEQWLEHFLNARPDLTQVSVVLLAGELQGLGRFVTAFPNVGYEASLSEVILGNELSQLRVYPPSHAPHLPYYFDGLRSMRMGIGDKLVGSADELSLALDKTRQELPRFSLFSVDTGAVKLSAFDRLLGGFIPDYTRAGGASLILTGIEDPNPLLLAVLVDRMVERDLVAAALQDHFGLNAVGRPHGVVSDVAPTILKLLGLPIPYQMTGRPLV